MSTILARIGGKWSPKTSPKQDPLANPCVNWLPMLYYECRRLNGLWDPFGMETPEHRGYRSRSLEAKWPVGPVWDGDYSTPQPPPGRRQRLNGLWDPFGIASENLVRSAVHKPVAPSA